MCTSKWSVYRRTEPVGIWYLAAARSERKGRIKSVPALLCVSILFSLSHVRFSFVAIYICLSGSSAAMYWHRSVFKGLFSGIHWNSITMNNIARGKHKSTRKQIWHYVPPPRLSARFVSFNHSVSFIFYILFVWLRVCCLFVCFLFPIRWMLPNIIKFSNRCPTIAFADHTSARKRSLNWCSKNYYILQLCHIYQHQ